MINPKFHLRKLRSYHTLTLCTIFCIIGFRTNAQQVSIQLGPDEIALNEPFTITITVENDQLRTYGQFPDIPGFSKRGTSSSSSTNIINGKVSSRQSIIQNYVADAEGTYQLEPFTMEINGKEVQSPGN